MPSAEFDLAALRQAQESLSRRMAWITALRLLALLAAVAALYFGFARALRRVDLTDLNATRDEIRVLAAKLQKEPALV